MTEFELLKLFRVKVVGKISKDYYVYQYEDALGVPFYVGLGTRDGKTYTYQRCYQHLNNALKGHNSHLCRKLRKMRNNLADVIIKIIRSSSARSRMAELEQELILEYGQVSLGGTLCNVAHGGDGGKTVENGSRKINNGHSVRVLPPGKRLPTGWAYGDLPREHPRVACYCPKTGRRTRVYSKDEVPRGYVLGTPKGAKSGPKGKQIWHDPKSQKMFWLTADESKAGLVRGRSNQGSTSNRFAVYNETTGKTKFLRQGSTIPKGYRIGAQSKASQIKGMIIYHRIGTTDIIYVNDGDRVPKGYVKGRPPSDSVKRQWYHHPDTGHRIQVTKGETPPKGYVAGVPKNAADSYSKRCAYKGKRYRSVQECCNSLGITRYHLYRDKGFSFC